MKTYLHFKTIFLFLILFNVYQPSASAQGKLCTFVRTTITDVGIDYWCGDGFCVATLFLCCDNYPVELGCVYNFTADLFGGPGGGADPRYNLQFRYQAPTGGWSSWTGRQVFQWNNVGGTGCGNLGYTAVYNNPGLSHQFNNVCVSNVEIYQEFWEEDACGVQDTYQDNCGLVYDDDYFRSFYHTRNIDAFADGLYSYYHDDGIYRTWWNYQWNIANAPSVPSTTVNVCYNVATPSLDITSVLDANGDFALMTSLSDFNSIVSRVNDQNTNITIPATTTFPRTFYLVEMSGSNTSDWCRGAHTTITVNESTIADPGFGNGFWNVLAYRGNNVNLTGLPLVGRYVEPLLSYDSRNRWCSDCSPANASGYIGCNPGVDNHTVVSKRTGFPLGTYTISVNNHDDDAQLYINGGAAVFQHIGCCDAHANVWTGILCPTSTVEFRHAEGGGGSHQGLNIAYTAPNTDFGTNSWNVFAYAGQDVALGAGTTLYGTYTENLLTFDTRWRWPDSPAQTTATGSNGANGAAYSGCNPGIDNHTVVSKRRGFPCGVYSINVVNDDEYRIYVNGGLVDNGPCCNSGWLGPRWTGFLTSTSTVEIRHGEGGGGTYHGLQFNVVTPAIAGGTVATNQTICNGADPANLTSTTAASGGTTGYSGGGTISYQWESSPNNSTWTNIGGATGLTYDPPALTSTMYYRRRAYDVCNTTGYSNTITITVQPIPNAGVYNDAGPVEFCDHAGNVPQISVVSGSSGSLNWQWGTAGGAWYNWVAGANAGTCCFPVNPQTAGADRFRVIASHGACTATGATVLMQNMNSPAPSSLTASANNVCANATVTLTATFPFANNSFTDVISNYSSVQFFSGSCGGTLLGTVAHTNGVATINVTPTVNTTYYARSTSVCETSGCGTAFVTVNIETTAPTVTSPGNQTLFNSPANSCLGSVILSDPGVADACGGTLTGTENLLPASGLVLWTRADAGVQLDDLNRVEMWKDLSGAGNHITQTTESARPVVANNAINGLPAIRFNTSQFMTTATSFNQPYTIFTISKMNNGTDRRFISSATINWLMGCWGGNQNVMHNNAWLTASSGPTPDNLPHMYSATSTGATTVFYDFGVALASGAGGSSALGRLQINGYSNGLNETSDGDAAEIIIYNRVLTAAERQKVEGYLAYKYNLQVPLASMQAAQSFPIGANTANYQGVDAAGNTGSTTSTVTVSSYPGPTVTPSVTTLCTGGTATMTLTGMAPSGQALNCVTNGYLAVPNVPLGANWTVETWFEILGGGVILPAGSWNTFLRGPSAHHQIIVQRSNWELGTYLGGFFGSGFRVNTLSTGWHHMAAVGTGTTTTFYIDGVQVGIAPNKSTESIAAIGNYQAGNQPFGRIDDVRIWNTALSQKNINDWMTRSVTASHPNWTNLIAYYQLNSNGTNTKTPGTYTGVPTGTTTSYVNSAYYNYVWSGPGGTFSNNNNTSESTVISNPATGTYNVYATANGCNSTTIGTAITAVANPVAPTATKSPNVASVCIGQTLTLTGVTDNGGGIGCQIQYSVNGGAYSATLPSFAATVGTNTIAIKKTNCTAGLGCNESAVNTYSWTVVADPAAPTATKSPNVASVCVGQTLTLTGVTDNGGGVGCQIQYSVNGGAYSATLPSFAATVGTNTIAIKKTNCTAGLDCNESSVNTYSWTVVADPAAPTATKSPNVATVCEGQTLTLTGVTDNGGGIGCEIQYSVNGGAYSTTPPSFAATVGTNTIAIKKTNCTAGLDCNESSVSTYSWTVVADPTITANSNTTICAGGTASLSSSTSGGTGTCTYQWQISTTGAGGTYTDIVGATGSGYNTVALGATTWYRVIRSCDGSNCNTATSNVIEVTVAPAPVAGAITKIPNVAGVCQATNVSATITAGSGGGGIVTDVSEYSTNGGANWNPYVSGTNISTVGLNGNNVVQIRTRRESTGSNCSPSAWNTVFWTVDNAHTAATITNATPPTVCAGDLVTLSTNANAGTNGSISWYTGPGATGTFIGNSSITTATPMANTTYYAYVSGSACPNLESSVSVTARNTNSVALPGTGTYSNLQEQCTINGWTYYALAGSPNQWIFAIRKNVQSVTPTFDVDLASHTGVISSVKTSFPSHGSYLMRRYWNVTLTSGSIANGIDIRFYYDPADMAAAVAARDADYITYNGSSVGPTPQWFKTNASAGGFHPSLLTPGMGNNWTFPFTFFGPGSSTGVENNVTYVQFDGLTSLSGGTGGTTFGESFPLLPVELVSLTANANESSISVNWVTASEINNEKFEVLRSTDAVNFIKVGEIAGNGTTNATNSYSFEDMDVEENVIYYYKLRQVDYDGAEDYSEVVSAVINTEGKFMIGDLIPNPAQDYSYVEIISPVRGNINFLITNVVGQEMLSGEFLMEEGSQRLYFDIEKLLPGNYIITIVTDTGVKEARKLQIIR
jgi:hypothetical protein